MKIKIDDRTSRMVSEEKKEELYKKIVEASENLGIVAEKIRVIIE